MGDTRTAGIQESYAEGHTMQTKPYIDSHGDQHHVPHAEQHHDTHPEHDTNNDQLHEHHITEIEV